MYHKQASAYLLKKKPHRLCMKKGSPIGGHFSYSTKKLPVCSALLHYHALDAGSAAVYLHGEQVGAGSQASDGDVRGTAAEGAGSYRLAQYVAQGGIGFGS